MKKIFTFLLLFAICTSSYGLSVVDNYNKHNALWKITYYCACSKCCGKWADGSFASGRKVYKGGIACNWLPFGTKVKIQGHRGLYTVEDRGAKSLFGDKNNHIRHIDIYLSDHNEALKKGVEWRKVTILK